MEPISEVHRQVWIGNITAARTASMQEYDAIITVCQDSIEDHVPEGVSYHFFEMSDGPDNVYGGRCDYPYFESAAQVMLTHLVAGHKVLIHCHAGQSRSAAVAIAALGAYEDVDYHTSFDIVKSRRPQVNPDMLLREHARDFIEQETGIAPYRPFTEDVE